MVNLYSCKEDDRIDLITLDHYGSLDMLPQVLASNIHLSKLPLVLKAGTLVSLPVESRKTTITVKKEKDTLW